MKTRLFLLTTALLASTQAAAWGDFIGNALKSAVEQTATNAVQQAAGQAVQPQTAQNIGQGVSSSQPYGVGGCVQNVPAGPPGVVADVDHNGCVTHLEYSNYVTYLGKNAPVYLGAGNAAAGVNQNNTNTANSVGSAAAAAVINQQTGGATTDAKTVGSVAQGIMGLFGH